MGDYTSNEAGVRNTNALPSPGLVHGRTRQESKPLEDSHSRAICDADRCSCVDARFISTRSAGSSAALDAQDLVEMNRASTVDQKSASQIAREWLISEGLVS